jgi:hypothetical protein
LAPPRPAGRCDRARHWPRGSGVSGRSARCSDARGEPDCLVPEVVVAEQLGIDVGAVRPATPGSGSMATSSKRAGSDRMASNTGPVRSGARSRSRRAPSSKLTATRWWPSSSTEVKFTVSYAIRLPPRGSRRSARAAGLAGQLPASHARPRGWPPRCRDTHLGWGHTGDLVRGRNAGPSRRRRRPTATQPGHRGRVQCSPAPPPQQRHRGRSLGRPGDSATQPRA